MSSKTVKKNFAKKMSRDIFEKTLPLVSFGDTQSVTYYLNGPFDPTCNKFYNQMNLS